VKEINTLNTNYLGKTPLLFHNLFSTPVMGKRFWDGAKEKIKNFRRADVNY
jgi:hypothetical protein